MKSMSQEFEKLGRELEADETVRVVVLQSALLISLSPTLVCAALQAARKVVSHTRSFRLTADAGERFRSMPKVTIAKVEGRARGGGSETSIWPMDFMCLPPLQAIFSSKVALYYYGCSSTQRLPRPHRAGDAPWRCFGFHDLSADAGRPLRDYQSSVPRRLALL